MVAANPDRWYLAHLLSLIGFALLVPAILGLTQLVGQRRAALADLGGTLALLGVLAATGLLSIDGFGVWQMAQPAADRAEMAALLDRILTSPRVLLPLYLVSLASAVGLLVLTLGMYRVQVVPAWTAGLVAIPVKVETMPLLKALTSRILLLAPDAHMSCNTALWIVSVKVRA